MIDVNIRWKNGWTVEIFDVITVKSYVIIRCITGHNHPFCHLILTSITIIHHYNSFTMLGMPATRLYQNLAKVCVSSMFCVASVSCVWVFAKTLLPMHIRNMKINFLEMFSMKEYKVSNGNDQIASDVLLLNDTNDVHALFAVI